MSKVDDVRNYVKIPKYFEQIIVPQLGSYYSDYPVDFDARPVACCPLHDEDTPSMRYYEETNSFYCFGCRKGGDVIQLHRLFMEKQNGDKPNFKDSVDFLYDYFITGKENVKVQYKPIKKIIKGEFENTPRDVARFSQYITLIEGQLQADTSLTDNFKRKIWNLMDNCEILVSKDLVSVNDAMKDIKDTVAVEYAAMNKEVKG